MPWDGGSKRVNFLRLREGYLDIVTILNACGASLFTSTINHRLDLWAMVILTSALQLVSKKAARAYWPHAGAAS
jgi:hypothetical protein